MKYKVVSPKGDVIAQGSFEYIHSYLHDKANAYRGSGFEVVEVNMGIAPPAAGLGDVRPASSGPVSFGFSASWAGSKPAYYLAEPVS